MPAVLDLEVPGSTVHVRPWPDPVLDSLGHDPRSAYVERFWLAVLGPSATWCLRYLATELEASPEGFALDIDDMACALGLGATSRSGRAAPIARTLERVASFGFIQAIDAETIVVRHRVPPLNRRQLQRLPERLRSEHEAWMERAGEEPGAHLRRRARALALSLLELGEDYESAERQLHRWKFHPALAHEAMRWASEQQSIHGRSTEERANREAILLEPTGSV